MADGLTIWLTGLASSGKTTLALSVAARFSATGYPVEVLDGDTVRADLCRDLGYSTHDRITNASRVGFVADLLSRNGVVAICALISPIEASRAAIRTRHGSRFFEVYIFAPLEVCRSRDVKGLYSRHAAGELSGVPGVDEPYEPPTCPDLIVPTHEQTVDESTEVIFTTALMRLNRATLST